MSYKKKPGAPVLVCAECGLIVLGIPAWVDLRRYSVMKGQDQRTFVLCGECADRLEQSLASHVEPAPSLPLDRPLRLVTRGTRPA